jgi:hypothetical protein
VCVFTLNSSVLQYHIIRFSEHAKYTLLHYNNFLCFITSHTHCYMTKIRFFNEKYILLGEYFQFFHQNVLSIQAKAHILYLNEILNFWIPKRKTKIF